MLFKNSDLECKEIYLRVYIGIGKNNLRMCLKRNWGEE